MASVLSTTAVPPRQFSNVVPFPTRPINDNGASLEPIPSDRATIAMAALNRLRERLAARPDRSGGIVLREAAPDCPHGCESCYLACAVLPGRIKWWEAELTSFCSSSTGRA